MIIAGLVVLSVLAVAVSICAICLWVIETDLDIIARGLRDYFRNQKK